VTTANVLNLDTTAAGAFYTESWSGARQTLSFNTQLAGYYSVKSKVCGTAGRGLHSSTCQHDLSRVCH